MREYSKVAHSVWGSKRFKKLSDDGKLLYLNTLTSPRGNSSGIFPNEIGYIMVDLKWAEDRVRAAIEEVAATGLIGYDFDEGTVVIDLWFIHNPPTNPKHAQKVLADTLSIGYPSISIKHYESYFNILSERGWSITAKHRQILDSLSIPYPKGIATETSTSTSTETIQNKTSTSVTRSAPELFDNDGEPDEEGLKNSFSGEVEVSRSRSMPGKTYHIAAHLSPAGLQRAKLNAPSVNIIELYRIYDEKIAAGTFPIPDKPDHAFPAWCQTYEQGVKRNKLKEGKL